MTEKNESAKVFYFYLYCVMKKALRDANSARCL